MQVPEPPLRRGSRGDDILREMATDESDIFRSECGAGDNVAARKTVRRLIENIDAKGVDVGPLSLIPYTEPLAMLLMQVPSERGRAPASESC